MRTFKPIRTEYKLSFRTFCYLISWYLFCIFQRNPAVWTCAFTVYVEGSRGLRFAHAVLWHTGVGALVLSSHLAQTETVVAADLKPANTSTPGWLCPRNLRRSGNPQKLFASGSFPSCIHTEYLNVRWIFEVLVLFFFVPAPGQLSLFPPPADSRSGISMYLAEELHRIVSQHHLVHRLFGEDGPLWNHTAT